MTPTSGELLFKGKPIGIESKKCISYLPEKTYLDKSMTVNDTIKYFSEFYENFNPDKARHLIKDLNLDCNQKLEKMS